VVGAVSARNAIRRVVESLLSRKTERRLAAVILLTTMIPLATSLYLATSMFRQAAAIWFNPEIGEQLDRGVDVYKDYVSAVKENIKSQTDAIAADPILRDAATQGNIETLEAEVDALFTQFPALVELTIHDAQGQVLSRRSRSTPVGDSERIVERRRKLTFPASNRREADAHADDNAPELVARFAVASKRTDELDTAGALVRRYHQLEASRSELYQGHLRAFYILLGITAAATIILGAALARGLTRRIRRLGAALNVVAQGDLAVRVPVTGSDELTDLARTFNQMIADMAQSRARIDFLQRMGAWQEIAQRLAHEIKNPLTPIQLAVQEVHTKYPGTDAHYKHLLDTTLEIVEEEVGTLRRLVSNFSTFARLPHAELEISDLTQFLRECAAHLGHLEDPSLGEDSADNDPIVAHNVEIEWRVPVEPLRVAIDRQMLRRVLINLVRNAVQAIRDARSSNVLMQPQPGRVRVSATRDGDGARIEIEDDGPGITEAVQKRIFEPYFTTKTDGTGLGLAIVKKIVVEHGGGIEASRSSQLGGARFVVHLPSIKVLSIAETAREVRESAIKQGVQTLDDVRDVV